jgi:hypothetical protein
LLDARPIGPARDFDVLHQRPLSFPLVGVSDLYLAERWNTQFGRNFLWNHERCGTCIDEACRHDAANLAGRELPHLGENYVLMILQLDFDGDFAPWRELRKLLFAFAWVSLAASLVSACG